MRRKVILDLDPGIDDSLALIYTVLSQAFDILGITTVAGNVDPSQGACNASYLCDVLGLDQVPIYEGAQQPLERPYRDARDTHGEDGLGEAIWAREKHIQPESARAFIQSMLQTYPNEVEILALGPLTNLAQVIQAQPGLLSQAKALRIMGGAYQVTGNCSPYAEYNFWCDPEAARLVFQSDLPETYLYPLDVTYQILMTPNCRELIRQFDTELGQLIHAITRFYVDFHWQAERTLGCVINDPLVPVDMVTGICQFIPADIQVLTSGERDAQSVIQPHPAGKVQVAQAVDAQAFFKNFLGQIFPDQVHDIQHAYDKGWL
ncbi:MULTISPECIES: nucleoside hydrolase [Aerococcus]|uniref:Nucleoside hydrolase n=1 Tax=Aerococcus sanguinicola TaxID=119206 RepID=A0A5N1GQM0_9LACT|nr:MULTISPECIES: nucleoside hydrolase [Aerococcus]KAA9302351.1 nucleoside hydrolase [Aerococcus sanguinicola]MDK6370032.1 nucleoside hydrolase [Aerococcus sp. UMB9870]MDK6680725.1 nucleoside hydrolase [Aerococcus sp. UMB8608]MDK6687546.1 nucleoside hydrolase [Aerococcus sp. UMB8623]MDK6939668.1 nucleoside hydrolase [Aerococcus sp. UMB8487]